MNLSSARELKASLIKQLLPNLPVTVRSAALPGGAARSRSRPAPARPKLAIGLAPKGRGEFDLAVRVQERAMQHSRELELITSEARGEVDVRYIGRVHKLDAAWFRGRRRPLQIGVSVGHVNISAGTLGAFVKPRVGGKTGILSNNHVLANENRGKVGDDIIQPGDYDTGSAPADRVAALAGFVRLQRNAPNGVDAAWASLRKGVEGKFDALRGLGKLKGVGDGVIDEGMEVAKLGRTTGLTRGKVTAFEVDDVAVEFDVGVLTFNGQIEIEGAEDDAFSAGGDSGSLIVGNDRRAVALLFAGGDQGGSNGQGLTYANPIHDVLDQLDLQLVL